VKLEGYNKVLINEKIMSSGNGKLLSDLRAKWKNFWAAKNSIIYFKERPFL
jgi:hypothetical protein